MFEQFNCFHIIIKTDSQGRTSKSAGAWYYVGETSEGGRLRRQEDF